MGNITAFKLSYLKEFIERKFPEWKEYYGQNLVGVHIGYKETDSEFISRYSIVFHVKKKYKKPSKSFPVFFELNIPKIGLKKIPTDVIDAGKFELQSTHLGKKVKPKGNYSPGTVGFFVKRNGWSYLCSNMHVLGKKYVKAGHKYYYKHVSDQKQKDILIAPNKGGYLEEGFFEDIDAAIARIHPNLIKNQIPEYGRPKGFFVVNFNNLNIIRKKNFFMYGAVSQKQSTKLFEIGKNIAIKPYGNYIYMTDLIKVRKCSIPGDSGSPVFEARSMMLLGIVVGSDSRYTYLFPIKKILNRFNAKFLYQ
jgi:hypothetical protein